MKQIFGVVLEKELISLHPEKLSYATTVRDQRERMSLIVQQLGIVR